MTVIFYVDPRGMFCVTIIDAICEEVKREGGQIDVCGCVKWYSGRCSASSEISYE